MFQTQQIPQADFSYFPHHSHSANSNPNPSVFYASFTSDPHSLGINPYVTPSSYTSILDGFEGQPTTIYQDPNAVSQTWIVEQVDPVRYAAAIKSLSEALTVATNTNSLWNGTWMNPMLMNNVAKIGTNPTKVMKTMRCEVCKVDCNSKDAFGKHLLGKKHRSNLQMQIASTATMAPPTSRTVQNANSQQMTLGGSVVAVGGELETKKQKLVENGAKVDSVRICTICNVVCNSQLVFDKHLAGRKHAIQSTLKLLSEPMPFVAVNPNNGTWRGHLKKAKIAQVVWCNVCNISCNSYDVLSKHKLGKKHLLKIEKLKNTSPTSASTATSATTDLMIGLRENPEQCKSKNVKLQFKKKVGMSQEDLDMKKQTIAGVGMAADADRMCTICNVVCNSKIVFNSHVAGRKHAAAIKKRAQTGLATVGYRAVTAA